MNEGAGDVWRVAMRQLPHRIHSSLLESIGVVGFGRSRGSAGLWRIARFRRPWLQRANAGHPWPACAIPPRYRVFRRVGSWLRSLPSPTGRGAGVMVGTSRHAGIPTLSPTPLPVGEGLEDAGIPASFVARISAAHPGTRGRQASDRRGGQAFPNAACGLIRATSSKKCSHVPAAIAPLVRGRRGSGRGSEVRLAGARASLQRSVGYSCGEAVEYVPGGAGQTVASCASMPRKVRAPQGTVPGNAWAARADGKCNRKIPPAVRSIARWTDAGKGEMVR